RPVSIPIPIPVPKPALDTISLTSIDPATISEKGPHKYTLRGSGLTPQTMLHLSVPLPAFVGSKPKTPDFRPVDVSPDGTRITVYVNIGAQRGKSSIRIQARTPTSTVASLDVAIKR